MSYLRSRSGFRVTTQFGGVLAGHLNLPYALDARQGRDHDVVDLLGQLIQRGVGGDPQHEHGYVVGAAGQHLVLDAVRQLKGVAGASDVG